MADEVTHRLAGWLAEAAEGLGARLRRGGLSREARQRGRLLLRRAFDALEAPEAPEVADAPEADRESGAAAETTPAETTPAETTPTLRIDLALLRAVDAAAHPLAPAIPRPPRIGVPPLTTNPDPAWIDRLLAVETLADLIAGRTERLLAGLRDPEVRRALGRVVTGPGGEVDLTLTEG